MGARFKCKKCKKRFEISEGRAAVQEQIEECDKFFCPLKHRNLSIIPEKKTGLPMVIPQEKPEEVVEIYEDIPIGGLHSYKEMRKKHGFGR